MDPGPITRKAPGRDPFEPSSIPVIVIVPGDGWDGVARWQSAPERAVSLLCPRRRDARRETAHAPPSRAVAAVPCRPAAARHCQEPWPGPRHREQVPEPSARRRPDMAGCAPPGLSTRLLRGHPRPWRLFEAARWLDA